jgi:hypothetical protein
MSSGDPTPDWRRRRAVLAVLVVVSLLIVTALVLWAVRPEADDESQAVLSGARPTESPVPLADGEAYVRTEVLPSDDLLVTHWIQSAGFVFSVKLGAPLAAGTEDVTAEQVRVTANGQDAPGPTQIHSGMASRYAFVGATSLEIQYRLTDVVQRSSSAPGRALARMTALDVTYEPSPHQVTRTVIAPEVLSLACSSPVRSAPLKPCGVRISGGEWTVELFGPAADDRVIAQLTLD